MSRETAKPVVSLDRSNGRFLFGIGCGWNAEEMANHARCTRPAPMKMHEKIEAMKQIWA